MWTAVIVAVVGAVLIEVIRERGQTRGDVALALLFYGGLAGGIFLSSLGGESAASLNRFLFGSLTTLSVNDVVVTMLLAAAVLVLCCGLAHSCSRSRRIRSSRRLPASESVLTTCWSPCSLR